MTRSGVDVRLRIEGHNLPGRHCGPYDEVQVALQVGSDPVDPVPGDATEAVWQTVVSVVGPTGAGALFQVTGSWAPTLVALALLGVLQAVVSLLAGRDAYV